MANVRSRVALRIWVSGLLLAFPQIFLGGLTVANSLVGTSGLVGTSRRETGFWVHPAQQRPFDPVFYSGTCLVVLSLRYFSNYLKVSSCTRYWQCGRRILSILFMMCFYQFFSSFTCKLLPCFAMDGRHSRSEEMPCM